jgi:hypothetical protein
MGDKMTKGTRVEAFTGDRQQVFYRAGWGDRIQIGIANADEEYGERHVAVAVISRQNAADLIASLVKMLASPELDKSSVT